jgi:hypothetical protein
MMGWNSSNDPEGQLDLGSTGWTAFAFDSYLITIGPGTLVAGSTFLFFLIGWTLVIAVLAPYYILKQRWTGSGSNFLYTMILIISEEI